MKNYFRPTTANRPMNRSEVANITAHIGHGKPKQIPMIGCRWRRQGKPGYVCIHFAQPCGKPAALEAGMTGQEDATVSVDITERTHAQTFQGALPVAQRSSSWFLSRNVSIACQKPR